MTATAASSDRPVDGVAVETDRRLWRGGLTFLIYIFTGGLYGIWWFFVSRQEMAEELDRKPSPGVALLEGVGQLVPVLNAWVWYRTITDMNELRERFRAPALNVWGWVAAVALAFPCIYIIPEILGPLTDTFNQDVREIIKAVGYALVPAQFLVFGYMVGYWNEYWMEKLGDRAARRRFGLVDILFIVLAALAVAGLIMAAVSA